jgi:hypothetical protein
VSITNTAAASLLVEVVRDLARQAWNKATDNKPPTDAIEKIVERTVKAMIGGLFAELETQIHTLGLQLAAHELELRVRDVLEAFVVRGEIKPLGLDIEIVDKLDLSDVEGEK